MNLKKEGINEFLWDTLCKLQNYDLLKNYNLVGGTALSLQLGHRISDDIDLFGKEELPKEKILDFVNREISKNIHILNNEGSIFQILLDDVLKIDFVQYPYDLIDPLIKTKEGLRVIGKNDIAAMKMSATGTRGYEAKDFVDLYYLLKEMPIDKIVNNFKKKYTTEDVTHYQRSMIYFDDIPKASWDSIKLINDTLSISDVKSTLIREVGNYERRMYR